MIRLKSVRCAASVPPPGEHANSGNAQVQWTADAQTEIQVEGGWVAVFKRGCRVPRLVPMHAVLFAEPLESPKGFEAPSWKPETKA